MLILVNARPIRHVRQAAGRYVTFTLVLCEVVSHSLLAVKIYLKQVLFVEVKHMGILNQLDNFMADIKVDYALCGGYAIDVFLGKKTRPHKDLDVAVFWEDRDRIVQHMLNQGWDIYEPCGTAYLHKIHDVSNQKCVRDNIWCVQSGNPHYKFTKHEKDMYAVDFDNSEQSKLDYIEFLFNTRIRGLFLYRRNHEITRSLDNAILKINSTPCLAPELVLLYKSTASDNTDYQLDFNNAINKMNDEQLKWLQNSLIAMFPSGHEWIKA